MILEDDLDRPLVNARHVEQVPGRKRDVQEAAWRGQLVEAGLRKRSFLPPQPIRRLRNLSRSRTAQMRERQLALRCTIPGVPRGTAELIIAESGAHRSQCVRAAQLLRGAGRCPGQDESAGKGRHARTRTGAQWLRSALLEAALATRRTDSYLAAHYRRRTPRRGHGRASIAACHSLLAARWHLRTSGERSRELGGDYYHRRDPQRATRRLLRQLEALGHTVTLKATA